MSALGNTEWVDTRANVERINKAHSDTRAFHSGQLDCKAKLGYRVIGDQVRNKYMQRKGLVRRLVVPPTWGCGLIRSIS